MIKIQSYIGSDINITMLEHLLFYRSTLNCNVCHAVKIFFNQNPLAVDYNGFTVAE